jgi:hypothetical protein
MVPDAKKNLTSALTGFDDDGADAAARLAHLERDRWPEFERELRARRWRVVRFDCHHYGAERQSWEWMLWRCRTWTEVERVLNKHGVDWRREDGRLVLDRMSVFRCR